MSGKSSELFDDIHFEALLHGLPLWRDRNISVTKLEGGITNLNYLVTVVLGGHKYVARFALPLNHLLGLDREREIYNTRCAFKGKLGPDVVAHYPKDNLLVVRYIDGTVLSSKTARESKNLVEIAHLLKCLHNGSLFHGERSIFRDIKRYITETKKRNSWLPDDIDRTLKRLRHIEGVLGVPDELCPCHFDLMIGNFIDSREGIRLIDWEYSAQGDFRFDLAFFSMKAQLTKKEEHVFLEAYGHHDINLPEQVQLMKTVTCLREATWGALQLAISDLDVDFKKYATDNFAGFEKTK